MARPIKMVLGEQCEPSRMRVTLVVAGGLTNKQPLRERDRVHAWLVRRGDCDNTHLIGILK